MSREGPKGSGGGWLAFILLLIAGALTLALCVAPPARSQVGNVDKDHPLFVTNQGTSSATLVAGTTFAATNGIYNGNTTACDLVLRLLGDSADSTWSNFQAGGFLPIRVIKLTSMTCVAGTVRGVY